MKCLEFELQLDSVLHVLCFDGKKASLIRGAFFQFFRFFFPRCCFFAKIVDNLLFSRCWTHPALV